MQGLARVPVDLAELLTHIVSDVGIEAEARGSTVALETDRPLPVKGDPELLRSAMENVIRNAVRYGPPGSKVGIEARRTEALIEIMERDSGPGVPAKDLELIFEPFYRVDAARNRAVGGDGLGLAIAARAVGIHGGRIQARNLEGGGLVVQLTLPALEVGGPPVEAEPLMSSLERDTAPTAGRGGYNVACNGLPRPLRCLRFPNRASFQP